MIVVVDTTAIELIRSRLEDSCKRKPTQDPEADYNGKVGRKATDGYKLHTNADAEGWIRKIADMPSSVHIPQMLPERMSGNEQNANNGYAGQKIASLLGDKRRFLHRPYRDIPFTGRQHRENAARQKTRNLVKLTFAHLKRHFGLTKTRYLGQARNYASALLTTIASNLKRAAPKTKYSITLLFVLLSFNVGSTEYKQLWYGPFCVRDDLKFCIDISLNPYANLDIKNFDGIEVRTVPSRLFSGERHLRGGRHPPNLILRSLNGNGAAIFVKDAFNDFTYLTYRTGFDFCFFARRVIGEDLEIEIEGARYILVISSDTSWSNFALSCIDYIELKSES